MKKISRILAAICLASAVADSALAQDPQFSQFYATQLYLNPAFTGNTLQGRIAGNYRNQWPRVPGAFISHTFSYDYNLSKINSGAGLLLVRDKAGSGQLRYTEMGGLYAYHLSLTRKHQINAGVRMSYVVKDLDYSRLVFGDQFLNEDGSTNAVLPNLKVSYMDISWGMVYYSNRYWLGTALSHLNRPNESLTGLVSQLPLKLSVHGGYRIPVMSNKQGKMISSVTLASNYKAQSKWDQLDIGAYFDKQPMTFGLWYRGIPLLKAYQPGYMNNDAVIAVVGYRIHSLSIGYSYDFTISRLFSYTDGAHELSIVFEYPFKAKKKKKIRIPCAKF